MSKKQKDSIKNALKQLSIVEKLDNVRAKIAEPVSRAIEILENGIKDGRGEYSVNVKKNNLKRVKEWRENNSGEQKDCAKDLGLSRNTIVALYKELDKG